MTELLLAEPDAITARGRTSNVLVVDAHPIVRFALRHMIEGSSDLHAAAEATSASEALSAMFAYPADVIVVDLALPDGGAWELIRRTRERYPEIGIVVLTVEESDDQLLRALDVGASAYLTKNSPVGHILAAIRHAAVSPMSFSASGLAQALRRRTVRPVGDTLSAREHQVLSLLRAGHSVPQVAAALFVSLSTAKTYVARVYEKLGAKNRAQALMAAVQLGIFDEPEPLAI